MRSSEIILAAGRDLFGNRDLSALGRYYAPNYRQHSALGPDGTEGLAGMVQNLPEDFRIEFARIVDDGDMAAVHCAYYGLGPTPLAAFDVFRVEDGRIAEHWDALTPLVTGSASGRSQLDGPTEVTDLDKTEVNKALVAEFADRVLVGGNHAAAGDYVSTEHYHQHNPELADGPDSFLAALVGGAERSEPFVYNTIHRLIGSGNFVLSMAEGIFGAPSAIYDLWRVQDGRIVEQWDVIQPIPAQLPHGNGMF